MPNLPVHIDLARRAAERLRHPALEAHMGLFLLGSTSPDIRALTGRTREEYHFAPLDFGAVGDGVKGLFQAHPQLKSPAGNGSTRAFVAGYLTHLVLDESWIAEIYRPYFGNPDLYQDQVSGKVLDRALQLEFDRLAQEAAEEAVPLLALATGEVDVPFIPGETLTAWRSFVLDTVSRGFSWERLRFMARRIAAGDKAHSAHRVADEFLQAMPASLERMFEHVTSDDLAAFREKAAEQIALDLGEYLT